MPLLLLNGYLAVVTAAAQRSRSAEHRAPANGGQTRFAVLVPAHDEAAVIAATLDSITGQDYPPGNVSTHVGADHCTDDTAAIARRHGADVHERGDPHEPGKGPTLGWLLERLRERGDRFDAVVVIDADTTMSPGFLAAMDAGLATDRRALQGYYAVRDAGASPAAALRAAALGLRHYVRPLGRTALGGSCGLFGNGMVFRADLLERRRFSAHLTEDLEFQLTLLIDGVLVGFVPDAVVEAEMPTTLGDARSQNERWELGRLRLARSFVPDLLQRSLGRRSPQRRAMIDAVLDLLVPPLSVLGLATTVLTTASVVTGGRHRTGGSASGTALVGVASAASLGYHVLAGLDVAGVSPRALLHAPRLVLWKSILWLRVLVRPATVSWTRTPRNLDHAAAGGA